ncbi:hypothetical protein [Undibacterium sp. SXout20W]|uniref:hypothetical protein n=1 Tax=Undibacterium sp. SXout20W TaxID=3413051 RepID=UPI003BEFC5AD
MKTSFVPAYQLSADSIRLRPDNTASNFVLYAFFTVVIAIVVLTGLFSAQNTTYTDDMYQLSQYISFTIALILAMRVRTQIAYLSQIARVLRSKQIPQRIWQECVQGILFELLRHTTIASCILGTAFLFPYSPWSFAMPAVLIAIVNSLVLVIALMHYGFFLTKMSTWINSAILIFIILISSDGHVRSFVEQLNLLSTNVLIGLALIWPILLIFLQKQLNRRIPVCKEVIIIKLWKSLQKHLKRYSAIKNVVGTQYKKGTIVSLSSMMSGLLLFGLFLPNIFNEVSAQDKTPFHIFLLFIYSLVLTNFLIVKDIQWRYFLIPGKVQQRKLANNILFSSIEIHSLVLVIGVLINQGIAIIYNKNNFFIFVHDLPTYWLLPFEWIFVNTIAIFFASFNKPGMPAKTKLFLYILIGGGLIYLTIRFLNTPLFHVGPFYAGCLLALSYLLMRINNRRWNSELLLMRINLA